MSINFAVKDIYFNREQTATYFKSSIAISALWVFFLNLFNCLGLSQVLEPVTLLTHTIVEIISQYNTVIIYATMILLIVLQLTNNHAVIQSRKKDIGIMKAVGTYPRELYSFYLSELLILVILSFTIGFIIGFMLFIIIFLSVQNLFVGSIWNPNILLPFLMLIILLVVSFLFNGWEIRKLGQKTYSEIKTGNIKENLKAKLKGFSKKFLYDKSPEMKLAFKNLMRKSYQFRQSIILIGIAGIIMFSGFVGIITIGNSNEIYINQAQGEKIIAIGQKNIITAFSQGYEKFSNNSIPDLKEGDYLNVGNNLTKLSTALNSLIEEYNLPDMDLRIFTVENITETLGSASAYFVNETTGIEYVNYTLVGNGTFTRVIPLQGVNFGSTVQNWDYEGALLNIDRGVSIGDTLASELYEVPLLQYLSYSNSEINRTYRAKINAITIDPLNNGNSAYIPLFNLQENMNRSNYLNLMLIDYSSIVKSDDLDNFFSSIDDLIDNELGVDFGFIDLTPIFQKNIDYLYQMESLTLIFSIIMGGFIIFVIFQFQKGRIREDQKDLIIIKALGAKLTEIRTSVFIEQIIVTFFSLILALIGSMVIVMFFLMSGIYLPSVFVPLGTFLGIFVLFVPISFITADLAVRKYHKNLLSHDL